MKRKRRGRRARGAGGRDWTAPGGFGEEFNFTNSCPGPLCPVQAGEVGRIPWAT